MSTGWDRARTIADAVLYEGYLLYPYRASSAKNQSRWQFGVLGPPGAAETALGEDDTLSAQFLIDGDATITLVVRFLHLQRRAVEKRTEDGRYEPVDELTGAGTSWLTWDEAVESELTFGPLDLGDGAQSWTYQVAAPAASAIDEVDGGRLVRSRRAVHGRLTVTAESDHGLWRVTTALHNTTRVADDLACDKDAIIAASMIGTHLIAEVRGGQLVSLLDPPDSAAAAVAECHQHRCFPVLAGPPGDDALLLISPIILYDHPEIAEQSEGALYDSTEIDEILTLRVMTMTDEEKAQARATDPLAAQIIDRCDAMTPEAMQRLHGVLRDPHPGLIPEIPDGVDWWDPIADNAVAPDIDAVLVNGVRVARGSKVRLRPSRRADAQDMFFAGRLATVTSVHETVDGDQQVGVTVDDDPAAELHDWYGRYLYFAPDELEPLKSSLETHTERSSTWQQ
ncbi:hypothetical protein [Mycolicibacterium sphagni]|uniref:Uncharacterized protein n=1 Tax=Mycolicibacterium sphagni TaxID=1786 RepID=A0A255DLP3_9MYCO|nr:hypothetical protein [Mycolicibacterium sphagni]MCV7178111.1 hypothetical protein [Mycolicibacterium sphagni]OYN76563.1 hypothetical protein CG716_22015 [Mycolicibacterium sphagni]